ncbi:MAG: hypothetical protein M1606_00920 [Candidatus Thermoplasmatota archaeon]|nr:hypothetical protein [Candidatus Thermoplasmatota archaeon]
MKKLKEAYEGYFVHIDAARSQGGVGSGERSFAGAVKEYDDIRVLAMRMAMHEVFHQE